MAELFERFRPNRVIHLAAQAGVRHAFDNPHDYVDANVSGFLNILEGCRHNGVEHLVFASTSAVYGANTQMPFSVHQNVDHPVSLYARHQEGQRADGAFLCASLRNSHHGPSVLHGLWPVGPAGYVALHIHREILKDEAIEVFNLGQHARDFTYIDDIVEGVVRISEKPAEPDPSWTGDKPDPARSPAPYRLYNIGNNNPVQLDGFHRLHRESSRQVSHQELHAPAAR